MKIAWSLITTAFVLTACEQNPSPLETCAMLNSNDQDAAISARLVIFDFYEPETVRVRVNGETIVDGPLDLAPPDTGLNQVEDVELFEFNYLELERDNQTMAVCLRVPMDVQYIYLPPDFNIMSSNAHFIMLD